MNIMICPASPADAEEILAIYKPYVKGTAITFEYDVPTVEEFRQCGYKFNRWYNMVWMEKMIGDHLENQPPVRAFEDVL